MGDETEAPQESCWTYRYLLQTLGSLLPFPCGRDCGWVSSPLECHIDTLPHLICPRHGTPGRRGRWAVASTWSLSTTATFPPPFIPLPGAVRPPGATKLQWKADPGVPIQGLPIPPQVPSASPPKPHYHFWYPFSSLIQKWRERSWAPGLDSLITSVWCVRTPTSPLSLIPHRGRNVDTSADSASREGAW